MNGSKKAKYKKERFIKILDKVAMVAGVVTLVIGIVRKVVGIKKN